MDFDFQLDLSEMAHSLQTADIVAIYFPLLRKTLLVDARHSDIDPPLVKVVPMVATPEERFRSLRQLRPRFPKPDSITIIPWPKYVDSLVRLGIWEHIVRRFVNMGYPEVIKQSEACYRELVELEQEEVHRALTGDEYKSLWERDGTRMPPDEDATDEDDETA